VITRGRLQDNYANLPQAFLDTVISKYAGTRLGRQEIEGEILDDVPGALWNRALLEQHRVRQPYHLAARRRVVAIDPAGTSTEGANLTGIIVAELGQDNQGYVLHDLSGRYTPGEWAAKAVWAYHEYKCHRVIGEKNQGGEMVEHTLRTVDPHLPYKAVDASEGKYARAEPVAALYEQGKIHHVGSLPELEDQMCTWVPGETDESPDRMDALVWAITELMLTGAHASPSPVEGMGAKRATAGLRSGEATRRVSSGAWNTTDGNLWEDSR
jgi:predicted phage terminase large subunit-like protein